MKLLRGGPNNAAARQLMTVVVLSVVSQMGVVLVFRHAVGLRALSDWLVLSAIPYFLSFLDLGWAQGVATEMTRRVAVGDKRTAQAMFSRLWYRLTVAGFALAGLSLLLVPAIDVRALLHIETMSGSEVTGTGVLLCLYSIATLQASLGEAAFRAAGSFARGVGWLNVIRAGETAALLVTVFATRTIWLGSLAYLCGRVALTAAMYLDLHLRFAEHRLAAASRRESPALTGLVGPSLASVAFPVAYAIAAQAMTVLIGVRLGPAAVVTFTAVRLSTNLVRQLGTAVNNSMYLSIGTAYALGRARELRRLARRSLRSATAVALVAGAALLAAGPIAYPLWVGAAAAPSAMFVVLMCAGVLADVPWQSRVSVQMAVNRHARSALAFLLSSLAGIGLAWVTVPMWGLTAVPVCFLLNDLVVTPIAAAGVRRIIADAAAGPQVAQGPPGARGSGPVRQPARHRQPRPVVRRSPGAAARANL